MAPHVCDRCMQQGRHRQDRREGSCLKHKKYKYHHKYSRHWHWYRQIYRNAEHSVPALPSFLPPSLPLLTEVRTRLRAPQRYCCIFPKQTRSSGLVLQRGLQDNVSICHFSRASALGHTALCRFKQKCKLSVQTTHLGCVLRKRKLPPRHPPQPSGATTRNFARSQRRGRARGRQAPAAAPLGRAQLESRQPWLSLCRPPCWWYWWLPCCRRPRLVQRPAGGPPRYPPPA